ncbi:GntR family transcriptional regulator [Salinicola rhizosphaerae]|uniref:GntR family transcriptional regulator n=1 Tax=Salinicola rhizosphaerae TaxID=1443141 RepID=A0ABQ3DXS6_9GAMM|nr:GntR family transcriptional regulator [Salinicola rhizosphaerae]GHB19777.1 GntR family transcriptional regulator [Salinicola rhizosphaerae]
MATTLQTLWNASNASHVRQRLYDVLRHAIIRLALAPGQALSEKEIADTFNVSRQPVREAFIRLSEAGLVEVRPQRGTFVVKISPQAVYSARFVREAIEVAVAKSAAEEGLSRRGLDELFELVERQRRSIGGGDYDRFYVLDEEFHQTLSREAGHESAWRFTEEVKAHFDRVRYISVPDGTPLETLTEQHGQIVEAIAARDPVSAERAVKTHLRELLTSLPRLIERFPDLFDTH